MQPGRNYSRQKLGILRAAACLIPYRLLDTQIVSRAFKGLPVPFMERASISSIVASEFLLVQHRNPAKANYYLGRGRYTKAAATSILDDTESEKVAPRHRNGQLTQSTWILVVATRR